MNTRIAITAFAAAGLLAATGAGAGAHKSAGDGEPDLLREKGCASCHRPEDFAGFDEARLRGAIGAVAAGKVASHPELGELSESEVAEIAAWLARNAD